MKRLFLLLTLIPFYMSAGDGLVAPLDLMDSVLELSVNASPQSKVTDSIIPQVNRPTTTELLLNAYEEATEQSDSDSPILLLPKELQISSQLKKKFPSWMIRAVEELYRNEQKSQKKFKSQKEVLAACELAEAELLNMLIENTNKIIKLNRQLRPIKDDECEKLQAKL